MHVCEGETGEQLVRVVVPECRRRKELQVSHSCVTGGHFSNRKTEAALNYPARACAARGKVIGRGWWCPYINQH